MKQRPTGQLPCALSALGVATVLAAVGGLAAAGGAQAQTVAAPAPQSNTGAQTPYGQQSLGLAATALRAPGYVDLLGGMAYTSNALLTQGHAVADGIGFAGVDMDYSHQGPTLSLDAIGNVERLEYVQGSFPGTFYGQFNGRALWGQPTDLMQWQLSDGFGEGMLDPLSAPTPVNLQWVNYVSTGPYFNFNFGTLDRLTVSGVYSRTTFETSPFDSQNLQGGATFRHALSAVSSVFVQATDTHTEFLRSAVVQSFPGAAHGYDTRAAFLGYLSAFERTHLSISAGYNSVNYGGTLRGAPLANVELSRQMSPSSTVFVSGQTGYSTLGNSLQSPMGTLATASTQALAGTGAGAFASTAAAEPFKTTTGSLGWSFQRARTTLSLVGMASDQRYTQQATFDQNNATASVSVRRELGPTLSVQVQGLETFGHYGHIGTDTRATTLHVSLSRQFQNAMLTGYAQWLRQRPAGQSGPPGQGPIPVASFDDERAGIELTYDLIGHRSAGQQQPF